MDNMPMQPPGKHLSVGERANIIANEHAQARYKIGKAEETQRRQQADIKLFASFLSEVGYEYPLSEFLDSNDWSLWSGITYGLVEGYLIWQLQQNYAIGSINVRLATVKTYCKLAQKAGTLSLEAYGAITLVKGFSHKEGVHVDEKREISRKGEKKAQWTSINAGHAALLKQQPQTKKGRRDAALISIMIDHGLRVGEVAGLMVQGIDLKEGTITFYREKVDLTQIHKLEPDTLIALLRYLPDCAGPYLFPGHKGQAITTRAINDRVSKMGIKIGVEALSPHDLRHYWATRAAKNKTPIKALQTAGGWKSPTMPLRYAESAEIANEGVILG